MPSPVSVRPRRQRRMKMFQTPSGCVWRQLCHVRTSPGIEQRKGDCCGCLFQPGRCCVPSITGDQMRGPKSCGSLQERTAAVGQIPLVPLLGLRFGPRDTSRSEGQRTQWPSPMTAARSWSCRCAGSASVDVCCPGRGHGLCDFSSVWPLVGASYYQE